MMNNPHKALRNRSLLRLMITVAIIIAVASFLGMIRLRLDLTEDKRFTLQHQQGKYCHHLKAIFIYRYFSTVRYQFP
jgi:hypothetical protein